MKALQKTVMKLFDIHAYPIQERKKITKSYCLLLYLLLTTLSLHAQAKNSENFEKKCSYMLNDIATYQNLVNDNDVIFIFIESLSVNNQSFLNLTDAEKSHFIESQSLNQLELISSNLNVVVYRRSFYLNFDSQKQHEFKTWFKQFDFWIGKQLEQNAVLPKVIFLPTNDYLHLKSYFSES